MCVLSAIGIVYLSVDMCNPHLFYVFMNISVIKCIDCFMMRYTKDNFNIIIYKIPCISIGIMFFSTQHF